MESENTVKYMIYCDKNISNLKEFCEECLSYGKSLTADYIWQNECFTLLPGDDMSGIPCLYGRTNFGENINDEWIIVFLLFELTKQYSDIVVHVSDDDGEFLLIQAADELPSWLKPESSENRIFIHQGNLHIIPQPSTPAEFTIFPMSTPSIAEAYELVVGSSNTIASSKIQTLIQQKISGYPEKIYSHFHRAYCYIPAEIVYVLQKKPSLVANAVQAFYERDPIDINICSNLNIFQPANMVTSLIKFTKHLYGQLHQANISPSSKSNWKLPHPSEKHYKAACLGYKLTCGFEILLNRSSIAPADSEPSGRLWEQYMSSLTKYNYFQGEIEGSRKYMQILSQAKEHFKNKFCTSSKKDEIGEEISHILSEANDHVEKIKSCQNLCEEDSDDWLTITPEELDQMMLNMWGKDCHEGDVNNLSDLATKVRSFVDNVSSYEGAEVLSKNNNCHGNEDGEIQFEHDKFMTCLENLINPSKYSQNNVSFNDNDAEYDSVSDDDDVDDDYIDCVKENVESEMTSIFERMDIELKNSTIHKTFNYSGKHGSANRNDDYDDDDEPPLDIDINVIQNFLESFSSQDGLPGPVSSMLHSMGMNLPPNDDP